jgi:hypothetical protein
MRQRGKYQLQFMKTRNSNGVGNTIELDFNIDTMRITDTGVQDNSSSEKSSILTSFQRNSSIVSPPDNTTVKKSEVKYDSSTLRDLCKLQDDDF